MNRRSLELLEFFDALERVAVRAGSESAREAILALRPSPDRASVAAELDRVRETRVLLEDRPGWAPPLVPTTLRSVRRLEVEGSVLEGAELARIAALLSSAHELREVLADAVAVGSALARLRDRLHPLEELRQGLESTVDPEGELLDSASPSLRQLRRSLQTARSRIVRRLEEYLGSLPERWRVPDASVSVRDGRYVIPVRREGKGEVGGVIHGESATGHTLFVEPPVAIRLMNEIRELERDEAREVQRILRDWSGRLRPRAGVLVESHEALVDFDTLWARARAARDWEGHVPELVDSPGGGMEVEAGRHPLLLEQGVEVVPFDLVLLPEERAVVVSGPNTGGKTVLLKSLGLVSALAQSGVVPPVGPRTRLPVFESIFADIGDQQSIAESLSTFSAHLARAREILEAADGHSLVLIDEIGTGTDPDEGVALARAVLEELVGRGTLAVVTSHLGALKHLDREGSGVVNASLQFDPDRIAPTYRLQKGRPGRSYGLAIARKLDLPARVLDRAEGYLSSGQVRMEDLLERLQREEKRVLELSAELEREREEVGRLRAELEGREEALGRREERWERDARQEARELLLEARREVERAIREVRDSARFEDPEARAEVERRARRRVEEAARRQAERMPEVLEPHEPPAEVGPGDRVRLREGGTKGVVREVRDGRAVVEAGGLRLEVPAGELTVVERAATDPDRTDARRAGSHGGSGSRGASGRPGAGLEERAGGGWTGPDSGASPETDLRGLRVDEVEPALSRALDRAVLADLPELRIIHGKGTGALRARVAELLREDGRVEEFRSGRSGEGGSGVTVVRLGS